MRSHHYLSSKTLVRIVLAVIGICLASNAFAVGADQPASDDGHPDLQGVYRLVRDDANLPNGLKNIGGPDQVPLRPEALATQKTTDLKDDVAKLCLPVGPFRMMALPENKIEIFESPGEITMLFEDVFLGHARNIYLNREHRTEPMWNGDSVAHWEKEALVVDTTNFNSYTWLNGAGAPHSEALHLTERYSLVEGRKYLKVTMTADDPKVLTKPYSYTRYYEKVNSEIQEYVCWDDV